MTAGATWIGPVISANDHPNVNGIWLKDAENKPILTFCTYESNFPAQEYFNAKEKKWVPSPFLPNTPYKTGAYVINLLFVFVTHAPD
jgi:hypothetical protein